MDTRAVKTVLIRRLKNLNAQLDAYSNHADLHTIYWETESRIDELQTLLEYIQDKPAKKRNRGKK